MAVGGGESVNPYASPAGGAEGRRPRELRIATQNERVIHLLIDNFVVNGLGVAAAMLVMRVAPPHNVAAMEMLIGVATLGLWFTCYVGMETAFRRTLGKFLTGTMVITEDGRRPTFDQVMVRSLVRMIPFEFFSFVGPRQPIGWHDRWSGMRVVRMR